MESLKARTTRGLFWSFLDSFGVYIVKFGFSIVIARTLSPDDYGLMGMILIFIAMGQVIMQSGFSAALVQKKDTDANDLSTAFWFNVSAGVSVWIVLFFVAGSIADFFGQPILVAVTRVAALGIILNSLSSVHVAILTRELNFRRQTWINLVGTLISGTTGVTLALMGYEVWALVFQTLAGNLIYMAGLWITSKWRPMFVFNMKSFKSLFGFSYKILLQGIMDVIFTKAYFPLIGKIFTAPQLGFYTNANRFYELFIRQSSVSVTRVLFPAFSAVQDERERFNMNYLRSFKMIAMLMFAGTLILIISSRPFISLALTEKWLPAVPYMQLFFAEGFFFPLLIFNQNILLSAGRSSLTLKIDIIKKAVILLSILIVWRMGIEALIIGQVTATVVALVLSIRAVLRNQGLMFREIGTEMIRLATVVAVCFLVNYGVIESFPLSDWPELILKLTVIPLCFFLLARALRLSALVDLKKFMAEHLNLRLK
ncbi:MAG: lipopolysaccharide biosynthesis protein [Bacteroidales bacterium]|nr:lipopolysaccharide biosynthesis protein [Bacteroidales bacterium]MDT8374970.1 lipopolysaccharide biosynthesis protein [Bacteroidales bacterium]